jgi:aspartokinase
MLVFVVDNNDYVTSLEYLNNYIKHRDLVSFRANDNISIINFVGIKREYLTSTLSLIKNIITRENIEIFYMKADGLLITLAINRNALKNIINIFCNELGLTEK